MKKMLIRDIKEWIKLMMNELRSNDGTIEKTSYLSTRRSQRAQSLSVFQTPLGFSNVSAFSAPSAVKLGGIVISLEKYTILVYRAEEGGFITGGYRFKS
ncbi:hypothetical protein C5S32_02205 [ANME-1 cluster archaeon GoMg1]|nr:hypothetical protein [ANME-1 cluster archaeon GoMg1]